MDAKQVPLTELLEGVPSDARLVVQHDKFSTSFHPVGRMCHDAAAELRRLYAENEALQRAVFALETKLGVRGYELQIADLVAEVEALRADADRYRWIRRKVCIIRTEHLSYTKAIFDFVNLPYPTQINYDASIELDAAIDAARSKT